MADNGWSYIEVVVMDRTIMALIVYTAMWIWGIICMFVRDYKNEPFWVSVLWYGLAGAIAVAVVAIITRKP